MPGHRRRGHHRGGREKDLALSEILDCGFVQGYGSRPAVLEELSPADSDILFCMSNDDQDNIITSLVGVIPVSPSSPWPEASRSFCSH